MYVYKFKLSFDEVEDFVRDYEILSNQTFKDFHDAIIASIDGLDGSELASFYIADQKWEKKQEITLMDMTDEVTEEEDMIPTSIMSESIISQYMDDPHQHLIYEYDFLHLKTFYIELLKHGDSVDGVTYPCCTHSEGELPKAITKLQLDDLAFDDLEHENFEDSQEDYYDDEDLENLSDDIEI